VMIDLIYQWLSYVFIDDFGVFEIVCLKEDWEKQLQTSAGRSREAMRKAGFGVHKEDVGLGLPQGLGVSVGASRPYVVRVLAKKAMPLRGATRHAMGLSRICSEELECLVGHWAWNILLARSACSITHGIYAFIHVNRGGGRVVMWTCVRVELAAMLAVAPLLKADLELPWMPQAFAGDASKPGFGIVGTVATPEELRWEGRWASAPGWVAANVNRVYSLGEKEVWEPRDPREMRETANSSGSESGTEESGDESADGEESRSPKVNEEKERFRRKKKRGAWARRFGKRPPPSMNRCWDDVSRWKLVWKGKWRQQEHINVAELRVIAMLSRRLSLDRRNWGHKVLVATDSLVALGCLGKGRSSQYPLLRQCRILAAMSLGLRLRMMGRWLESERNPADGPSRDVAVGAAPETKQVHRDRAVRRG